MIKNLFPSNNKNPTLRFNEFHSNYKQLRLKEILDYTSSKLTLNKLEDNNGEYKLYGAEGVVKYIDFYDMNEEYISIIKDGAGVCRLHYCEPKSSIVATMGYLTLKNNKFNLRYIYYLLSSLNLKKYIIGTTIPHIYFKEYSKEKVLIPLYEEQNKIVDLMLSIDIKITTIINQIKYIKEFKKALLQKMFI